MRDRGKKELAEKFLSLLPSDGLFQGPEVPCGLFRMCHIFKTTAIFSCEVIYHAVFTYTFSQHHFQFPLFAAQGLQFQLKHYPVNYAVDFFSCRINTKTFMNSENISYSYKKNLSLKGVLLT